MKTSFLNQASLLVPLLALALGGMAPASAQLNLKHRYTFDEAAGTVAGDFYSGADGTLTNAEFTGTGAVRLNGTNAFVDLPNGIISALTNATFEAWVTWAAGAGAWQRVFDFGNSIQGEGQSGTGSNYVFLTARSGGTLTVFGTRARGATADNLNVTTFPLPTNTLAHVAVSYDFSNSVAKLYVNGAFAAQGRATQALSTLQDVNNWLGRSQYSGDAFYNGLINEFRIYDAALSAPRIAANAAAGPDNDAADPGNVTAVRLLAGPVVFIRGSQQGQVFADFDNATNVNVTFGEGATFSSGDTNIVTVDTNGVLRGIALGSAEVVGTYQGLSATSSVTVVAVHGALLKHRYSFGDAAGTNVSDSVGGAHGTLIDPSNRCVFTGTTLVLSNLANVASSAANGSFVDLPNGIIRVLTNATFEIWVRFIPVAGNWVRIYDFGDSGTEGATGTGTSYLFLTPRQGTGGAARFALKPPTGGETTIMDAPQLPNAERHIIVTYHTGINEARLYINGVLASTRPAPTPFSVINDINNWLGRSQFGGDSYLNAAFNELRIYEGTKSEGDVVASFNAGPDVTNAAAGNLVSISLQVIASMQGGAQAAAVLANYENVSNVDVTINSSTTFASSDTNILTVTTNGVIVAIAPGSATITATHAGLTDARIITVTAAGNASLRHRWNFNEASGTTVADSVGGKDGTIVNPISATLDGASLTLNNPNNNVDTNSYVNLPNHLLRVLTNATIETWVTWRSNFTANWQRILDLGSTTQGENLEGTGLTYLFLTPRAGVGGNPLRAVITTNSGGGERIAQTTTMAQNTETHIAIVYSSGNNGTNAAMSLYVNGTNVNTISTITPLSGLNDVNNWLGRAQYNDPYFNGSYNELRIHAGALLPGEIAANIAAGPNAAIAIPASIYAQPTSRTGECGSNTTFSVSVAASPAPTYQWFFGMGAITGATNSTLTLNNLTAANAGGYSVVVVNASGSVTSSVATLTIADTLPPVITLNGPNPMNVQAGTAFVDPGATATDLCAGPVMVTASGFVDTNLVGSYTRTYSATDGTLTAMVNRTVNVVSQPPVANPDGAGTRKNQPVSIPLAKLLSNDTDAENDTLTITAISATSTNGATVTSNATEVTYAPVPGFVGTDRFTYTISDGHGNSATGFVEIFVVDGDLPSQNMVSIEILGNGDVRIRFAGIPGRNYNIERTETLPGTWTVLDTVPAPVHGIIEFVDTDPPAGSSFYRTRAQ